MSVKILVACECSQVVTLAFRKAGFEAYSNDIVPCYGGHPEWHIVGDAREVVRGHARFVTQSAQVVSVPGLWSMIIAHPPCTMLTHSSAVALAQGLHTMEDVKRAREFFLQMLNAPCRFVAVENPAPMAIAQLPRYNQIVQPWYFGHKFSKRICLWLRGLPPLLATGPICYSHQPWLEHCASTPRRRSHFWPGVADAMALQWGSLL